MTLFSNEGINLENYLYYEIESYYKVTTELFSKDNHLRTLDTDKSMENVSQTNCVLINGNSCSHPKRNYGMTSCSRSRYLLIETK